MSIHLPRKGYITALMAEMRLRHVNLQIKTLIDLLINDI